MVQTHGKTPFVSFCLLNKLQVNALRLLFCCHDLKFFNSLQKKQAIECVPGLKCRYLLWPNSFQSSVKRYVLDCSQLEKHLLPSSVF